MCKCSKCNRFVYEISFYLKQSFLTGVDVSSMIDGVDKKSFICKECSRLEVLVKDDDKSNIKIA